MNIPDLAASLNEAAQDYEIGGLQELRKSLHGLGKQPGTRIFTEKSTNEGYAFHYGGRRELQFNIGKEEVEGSVVVRHGVAFSLEPSQTLPTIEPMGPKVDRFNDFVRSHPEGFPKMRMWHYASGNRSPDRPISPIGAELFTPGNFIMLGRWAPDEQVDVGRILADFDRLLPLYVYVETKGEPPSYTREAVFKPGCPNFVKRTTANRSGAPLEISLHHKVLQRCLYERLSQESGPENVSIEHSLEFGVSVDAAVRSPQGLTFYEVKVASTVQSCMRAALGQLLEYAHWPPTDRAHELIVVGEPEPNPIATEYLQFLRKRFELPLWYRRIDLEAGKLEEKV